MRHVHDQAAGRCCSDELASEVLPRLRKAKPVRRRAEPDKVFAQREDAWRRAIDREETRQAAEGVRGEHRVPVAEFRAGTAVVTEQELLEPGVPAPRDAYVLGPLTPEEGAAVEALAPGPGFVERTLDALNMATPKKKRASAKTGRIIFEVRYHDPENPRTVRPLVDWTVNGALTGPYWYIRRPVLKGDEGTGTGNVFPPQKTKAAALAEAVAMAKKIEAEGGKAQVVWFGKDGKRQGEWTYGDDPKRRRG